MSRPMPGLSVLLTVALAFTGSVVSPATVAAGLQEPGIEHVTSAVDDLVDTSEDPVQGPGDDSDAAELEGPQPTDDAVDEAPPVEPEAEPFDGQPEQDPSTDDTGSLELDDSQVPTLSETTEAAATVTTNSCAGQEYWMLPGCRYSSVFADPTVLPVTENGKTVYYAFGTTTSQLRLPVLRSNDLKSWYPNTYSKNTSWRANNYNFNLRPWPKSKKYDDLEALHPNAYYNPRKDPAIPTEIRGYSFVTKPPQGNVTTKYQLERDTWFTVDGLVSPRPSWATDMGMRMGDRGWNKQENWAPGVAKIGSQYFAYMSIRTKMPGSAGAAPDGAFCIAVATSSKPGGPYRYANGGKPVQCQPSDPGGAIDPEPVQYAGKWYLLWKGQGRGGVEQGLYAQPIDTSTGALSGSRITLLTRNTAPGVWEGRTIENPSMASIGGASYLIYSGGDYRSYGNNTSNYATGYAVCPKGPTAPCKRPSGDNRLLKSGGAVQGPGGGSLFTQPNGNVKLAYAAYTLGGKLGVRALYTTNIYKLAGGRLVASTGAAPIFADVPANHKFAKQIKWLADRGITTGDKNGNFRPGGNVSRSDMAAFLYRYAGSPRYTPKGTEPFADVSKGTKFYKEIRWMHSTGLSTGVRNPNGGKPSYQPGANISREAMAAFLYRLSGTRSYTPSGPQPLSDVTPRSRFYREIRWMYDNKITTGIKSGTTVRFDARGTTKRDAFAAFLMRYDNKFGNG